MEKTIQRRRRGLRRDTEEYKVARERVERQKVEYQKNKRYHNAMANINYD